MIVYLNQTRTENQKRICQDNTLKDLSREHILRWFKNTHNKNGHDSIIDLSRKQICQDYTSIDGSGAHIIWMFKIQLVNLVNDLLIGFNHQHTLITKVC